jgi:hypothetical protein
MKRTRPVGTSRLLRVLIFALTLSGCAGSLSFSSSFPNGGDRVSQALARAKSTPSPAPSPVIVGVADAPRAVFAYDLAARRLLFRAPAQVSGMPIAAGELVVVPEGARLTIRRLRDGAVLHTVALDGMQLIGAEGDASTSAVVLSTGGTINVRSRLLKLQGERITGDRALTRGVGGPAVLGGLTFLPHQRVHVSVVDPRGEEIARARIQEDVASQAFSRAGEVYFGQRGFYRFDRELEQTAKGGPHYWKLALKTKLPGAPPLLVDSSVPAPPLDSALHRVALSFAPGPKPDGSLGLLDDALYLAFYRQLFSLTPDGAQARWVYETPSDVVGVRAVDGGLLAVESSGVITMLDTQGRPVFSGELGLAPIAARIRAERIAFSEGVTEVVPMATQLERAARSPDTRLVPARAFAAQLLGPVEDDQAAQALIGLCGEEATPTRVREEACETLAQRKIASDAVLAALAQHADFMEDKPEPPLTALALAALRAGDRRATPALLAHLSDPATPVEALTPLLRAIAGLGDASTADELAAFVRLYHADSADEPFENVLAVAMDTLVKLERGKARAVLEPVANDQFARVGVRGAAQRKLSELGPETEEGAAAAPEAEQPADGVPVAVESGPPPHLTTQHIDDALSPVRPKLSRCVHEAPEHPASARLVLVIDGEGQLQELRALPESVRACIEPLVREAKFPATKYGKRSVMSYSVSR